MSLPTAFSAVREQISAVALRCGRQAESVRLVAVSKTVDSNMVLQAQEQCGQQLFGENRADELQRKRAACPDAEFLFIGTLQTNKVRHVVGQATLIHSVDSEKLLRAIDARAAQLLLTQPVLLQVNVSGEESKHGFSSEELDSLFRGVIGELKAVQIQGLMTMAPNHPGEEVRWVFKALSEIATHLNQLVPQAKLSELSMGMSGDFEVAIEEGATLVRIGSALFCEES